MSVDILIKRGREATIPTLQEGELGFCTDSFKLFIGSAGGNVQITVSQLTAAQILALLLTVDGTGSGLDADLLDGQSGAFYSPASVSGSAANILASLLTVDGAGSGLDADLLDGSSAAAFAAASHAHGLADLSDLAAGTYTPTLTNVANLDSSTAAQCQYLRVGNTVTVSGKVNVDPTSVATTTTLGVSLPVASNLGATEDLAGVGAIDAVAGKEVVTIKGDVANDRATFAWVSIAVSDEALFFTFTYQVI